MFPEVRFLQLDLYAWLSVIGIVAALVVFRIYSDKKQISAKLQNICLALILVSVAVGYGFAVLFQALYDFTKSGEFVINTQTGMTFYGGLIGGGAVFLALYFTVERNFGGGGVRDLARALHRQDRVPDGGVLLRQGDRFLDRDIFTLRGSESHSYATDRKHLFVSPFSRAFRIALPHPRQRLRGLSDRLRRVPLRDRIFPRGRPRGIRHPLAEPFSGLVCVAVFRGACDPGGDVGIAQAPQDRRGTA